MGTHRHRKVHVVPHLTSVESKEAFQIKGKFSWDLKVKEK